MLSKSKKEIINKIFMNATKKEFKNSVNKAHHNIFKDNIFEGINKTTNP